MINFEKIISEKEARNYNPIVLAFVGDAYQTLYIKTFLALSTDNKANNLNKLVAQIVNAKAQSEIANLIMPTLTEDEVYIFKRARNSKKGTKAKHASVNEYNNSTGIEAVIGYLYLTGNKERLEYIINFKRGETNATSQS